MCHARYINRPVYEKDRFKVVFVFTFFFLSSFFLSSSSFFFFNVKLSLYVAKFKTCIFLIINKSI